MNNWLWCVCFGVSVVVHSTVIEPYNLEADAREQLEELRSLVLGESLRASDDISYLITDVNIHRDALLAATNLQLVETHKNLVEELSVLVRCAYWENVNITLCLRWQYTIFMNLYDICIELMDECMGMVNIELQLLQDQSRSNLNTINQQVDALNYEITYCVGDAVCIEPVVREIEQATVSIPMEIRDEVQRTENNLKNFNLLISECTDTSLIYMNTSGRALLNSIFYCIEYELPPLINDTVLVCN